ncbi:unnamed protein product [Fusarium graminearum]|nr:unnamed protein product [Fusarium graminearum]
MNNIFFTFQELVPRDSGGAKAILVKPEVTEWVLELRQHANCSQFVHEALDIIEQKMLVVLSTRKTRSSSGELRREFERISRRCNSEREYTQGKPLTEKELREARDQIRQNTVASSTWQEGVERRKLIPCSECSPATVLEILKKLQAASKKRQRTHYVGLVANGLYEIFHSQLKHSNESQKNFEYTIQLFDK